MAQCQSGKKTKGRLSSTLLTSKFKIGITIIQKIHLHQLVLFELPVLQHTSQKVLQFRVAKTAQPYDQYDLFLMSYSKKYVIWPNLIAQPTTRGMYKTCIFSLGQSQHLLSVLFPLHPIWKDAYTSTSFKPLTINCKSLSALGSRLSICAF